MAGETRPDQKISKKHISTENISNMYTYDRNSCILLIIPAVPTGRCAGVIDSRERVKCLYYVSVYLWCCQLMSPIQFHEKAQKWD